MHLKYKKYDVFHAIVGRAGDVGPYLGVESDV